MCTQLRGDKIFGDLDHLPRRGTALFWQIYTLFFLIFLKIELEKNMQWSWYIDQRADT